MTVSAETARALHGVIEPLHTVLYLCPEANEEFERLGLEPRGQGYVAGRVAPLGAVGPDEAAPLFYNFNPALFAHALPGAWDIASPAAVLDARATAITRTMLRAGVPDDDAPAVVELARAAWTDLDLGDLPLARGNAQVTPPDQPHAAMWQALAVLREHRGDEHVALLREGEIAPVEALVLYAAWQGMVSRRFLQATRLWDDAAWESAEASLAERGWLDADGQLTEAGHARRDELEADTDRRAAAAFEAIGEDGCLRLFDLLLPLATTLDQSGVYKRPVPLPERPA